MTTIKSFPTSSPCSTSELCGLSKPDWHPSNFNKRLRDALRAGVAGQGNAARLRRVLRTLRAGKETVVVTAVGASVTADFGGIVGYMQDHFALGYTGWPSKVKGSTIRPGWLLPIGDMLHTLTPSGAAGAPWLSPNGSSSSSPSTVELVNAACAGHKLDAYLYCLATRVPVSTDLFLVDAATIPQWPQDAEATLRSFLALPRAPALLLVHFTNWCWPRPGLGPNDAVTVNEAKNKTCYAPNRLQSSWHKATAVETFFDELGGYYGIPSLSMRRAFGPHALRAGLHGGDNFFKPWELVNDGLHPRKGDCGRGRPFTKACHTSSSFCRCIPERYSQLIAGLVNSFLWDAWLRLEAELPSSSDPLLAKNNGQHAAASTAAGGGGGGAQARRGGNNNGNGNGGSGHSFELPCLSLYPGSSFSTASSKVRVERCFAWGADLTARAEKSYAPLLTGSRGFAFTEYDTALAADARDLCAAEGQRVKNGTTTAAGAAAAATASAGYGPLRSSVEDSQEQAVQLAGRRRQGGWSESECIRKLRLKSRPGLTAFEAGSVAFVRLRMASGAALSSGDGGNGGGGGGAIEGDEASALKEDAAAANELAAAPAAASSPVADVTAVLDAASADRRADLTITYLSSYAGMGIVRLSCRLGCSCGVRVIDAHRGEEELGGPQAISVYKTVMVPLVLDSRQRCVLELRVLNATMSNHHKFKISEMALVMRGEEKRDSTEACA